MSSLILDPRDGGSPIVLDWRSGYAIQPGPVGLGVPPIDVVGDQVAGVDGMTPTGVVVGPRDITIPVDVFGPDAAGFKSRRRRLQHACTRRSTITVTHVDDDGEIRSIDGYYVGGLEGDGGGDRSSSTSELYALKLRCPDPWWYGQTQELDVGLRPGNAFFPFFPLVLSPSRVQGQFTVDLSGADAASFPLWTVTGPGTSLVLTNVTTGRVIQVDAPLLAGESMVIDTRDGEQSVHRGDLPETDAGWNLMGSVTSDPALWPLVETVNTVTAQLVGASPGSRIHASYAPRYAGI